MSQWAREHPELCEQGYGYEDFHDPDQIRQEIKDGIREPLKAPAIDDKEGKPDAR